MTQADQPEQLVLVQPEPPAKPNTPRRKRPLAKRICSNCREKKARCELPDLFVPSSMQPVVDSKRCHRCRVLDTDCVVWDGDRKRRIKLPQQDDGSQHAPPAENNARTAHLLWSPVSHLADAAAVIGAAESPSTPRVTVASPSSSASDLFFELPAEIFVEPTSRSGTPSSPNPNHIQRGNSRQPSRSPDRERSTAIEKGAGRHQAGAPTLCPPTPFDREESAAAPDHVTPEETISSQKVPIRTWRSVWRTLSLLIDYAAQQPQFTRYLVHRIGSPCRGMGAIDVMDMIDRQECKELRTFLTPYLAWHPHLPSLESLYDLQSRQPEKSTSFLLASMYLVASRHRHPLSSSLMQGLSAAVDRLGSQVILSSVRDVRVVQALELLLAHEPSLIGTSVSGNEDEQTERGNGLAGDSILTYALCIAKDVGLDKSFNALHKLLSGPKDAARRGQIAELLSDCSLWVSLRLWEGHFVFVKPTTRVLRDLDTLALNAKSMIGVDDCGDRIEIGTVSADGTTTDHGVGLEETLRSAGRTVLAFRMQSMEATLGALAIIDDLLESTRGEGLSTQPQAHGEQTSATSIQDKDVIVDTILHALDRQSLIEQQKQLDMAPYVLHNSANLAEEWSQLESNTIFSMLLTFGICSLYSGQIDIGFSSRSFIDAMHSDKELSYRVGVLGSNRLGLSEKLVSSFVFFNRRLTIGAAATFTPKRQEGVIEWTGAPLFLTCALIVDSCKLFLEGAAFVLIKYRALQDNYNTRLLSMVHAAQRLEEFDRNHYGQVRDQDRQDDGTERPMLSICQVSAKFVKEMVDTMQKWKLASSIHRRPRLHTTLFMKDTDGPSAPAQTHQDASSSMQDHATHNGKTRGHTPAGAGSGHGRDYKASPLPRGAAMESAVVPNEQPVVVGPREIHHAMAGSGYTHHVAEQTTLAGQSQAPFMFPVQFWPPEAEHARDYGSVEHLLGGTFPESAIGISDIEAMFDTPFMDLFFEK